MVFLSRYLQRQIKSCFLTNVPTEMSAFARVITTIPFTCCFICNIIHFTLKRPYKSVLSYDVNIFISLKVYLSIDLKVVYIFINNYFIVMSTIKRGI